MLTLSSCNNKVDGVSSDDFQISLVEREKLNFVRLECSADKSKYDEIIWELPSGQLVSGYSAITAYFPYKGEYAVKVKITKGLRSSEYSKTVFVRRDDPYVAKGEKLVWNEEFDDVNLDPTYWNSRATHFRNREWGNSDGKANMLVENSILKLSPYKEGEVQQIGDYSSIYINTQKKKEIAYGRIEFRAKLPANKNIRPILSLLGNDVDEVGWPTCGEINATNQVVIDHKAIYSAVHTFSNYEYTHQSDSVSIPTFDTDFHIYGINWTPDKIDFYIDTPSNIYYTYNPKERNSKTWPFSKPFFVNIGLVMGGDRIGRQGIDNSSLSRDLYIDYIRVYQN